MLIRWHSAENFEETKNWLTLQKFYEMYECTINQKLVENNRYALSNFVYQNYVLLSNTLTSLILVESINLAAFKKFGVFKYDKDMVN